MLFKVIPAVGIFMQYICFMIVFHQVIVSNYVNSTYPFLLAKTHCHSLLLLSAFFIVLVPYLFTLTISLASVSSA